MVHIALVGELSSVHSRRTTELRKLPQSRDRRDADARSLVTRVGVAN